MVLARGGVVLTSPSVSSKWVKAEIALPTTLRSSCRGPPSARLLALA
jgi:hypothetical protein